MKNLVFLSVWLLTSLGFGTTLQQNASSEASAYAEVLKYDPSRNAAQDLQDAQKEAKKTNKHVLVEVGGDWASWCQTLDVFFQTHQDLMDLREKNYVTVAINFSKENKNKEVLSHFPLIAEYPHLFVLDADGKLLTSQWTSPLEQGESYDPVKMKQFLIKWAPGTGAEKNEKM